MFKIDPDFWKDVEDHNKLNFVIYGDSIAEHEKINVIVNRKFENLTFKKIWEILSDKIKPVTENNKEYIYINDEICILTYINEDDRFQYTNPSYLMRHKINHPVVKLFIKNEKSLTVTKNHSLLKYHISSNELKPISPEFAKYIIKINKSPKHSNRIWANKSNITPATIYHKQDINYNGYVYDFCVPETQNFVVNDYLVHNTDSLYVNIPNIDNNINAQEAWDKISTISNKINDIISDALNENILLKLGVGKENNRTVFKTESLIISMMLLGIKKNYAYKKIAEEGVIYDSPKMKYKGIPIVRSDFSKFTQQFIKYLIDEIALNIKNLDEPPIEKLQNYVQGKQQELFKELEQFNFKYAATPGRWKENSTYKKETFTIIGMRTYNTIINKDIFRPGTSGFSVPIKIVNRNAFLNKINGHKSNSSLFLNNTNIDNINYIVVPYNYEPPVLKEKFEEFSIEIDYLEAWEKNMTKIVKYIIDTIKQTSSN